MRNIDIELLNLRRLANKNCGFYHKNLGTKVKIYSFEIRYDEESKKEDINIKYINNHGFKNKSTIEEFENNYSIRRPIFSY